MSVWTKEMHLRMKELWARGLSCSQIGRMMGLSRHQVNKRAERNRAEFPSRKGIMDRRAKIVAPIDVKLENVAPDSRPRPWIERVFGECAFPVGGSGADTLSCCAPADGVYCRHHRSVMYAAA